LLPNERLTGIYSSAPSLQSAVCLPDTGRRLRAVWLEHSNHIIASILTTTIPAHEDALDLAVTEKTRASSGTSDTQCAPSPRPFPPHAPATVPTRLCLPRLLQNAQLTSSAATAWLAHNQTKKRGRILKDLCHPPIEASYYMMRKLLLARRHPEIQTMPAVFAHLCTLPPGAIHLHADFADLLTDPRARYVVKQPHGMIKPKGKSTEDELWEVDSRDLDYVHWDDWV